MVGWDEARTVELNDVMISFDIMASFFGSVVWKKYLWSYFIKNYELKVLFRLRSALALPGLSY